MYLLLFLEKAEEGTEGKREGVRKKGRRKEGKIGGGAVLSPNSSV